MLASREAFSLCRFCRSESSLFAYPEAWSLAQRAPWVNPHLLDVPKRHREHAGNGQSDAQLHLVHAADEVALKAEAVVDAVGDSLQCGAPAVAPMRARAALGRQCGSGPSRAFDRGMRRCLCSDGRCARARRYARPSARRPRRSRRRSRGLRPMDSQVAQRRART